jgi:hypothetical protein
MRVTLRVLWILAAILAGGCMAFSNYHVDAYNETGGFVNHAKVVFDNGKQFEWGTMNPNITAGMWPMSGSLGRKATVSWEDEQGIKHSQVVDVPSKEKWDSIKFVIKKDGVVSVEARRR